MFPISPSWRNLLATLWYPSTWKNYRETQLVTPQSFDLDFEHSISRLSLPFDGRISFPFEHIYEFDERLSERPHFYTRAGSQLEDTLAQALVQLEAGYVQSKDYNNNLSATLFSSGMAAVSSLVHFLNVLIPVEQKKDAHFVVGNTLYTDTQVLFHELVPKLGFGKTISVDTTNADQLYQILAYHPEKIIALFYESVSNPLIKYTDTRTIAEIAHDHDVPVVVDNTFLSPYLQQPFRLGADLVVQSLTKYYGGYGDTQAGAMVGPKQFLTALRSVQRLWGNTPSPEIMWTLHQRLRTLPARMQQHVSHARDIAQHFHHSPYIDRIYHPFLGDATRDGSPGGVLSFSLAGENPKEKIEKERALLQHLINHHHTPIANEVGFGQDRYLILHRGNFRRDTTLPEGLIRVATGRHPSVDTVIEFLDRALQKIYD